MAPGADNALHHSFEIVSYRGGEGMNTVSIPKNPPRDPAQYGAIDMWHNLKGYFFSAGIFGGLGLMSLASVFIGPYETGLIVFKITASIVFCYIGARLIYRAVKGHRDRVQAFTSGSSARGEIVSHGGTFVIWKSSRFYTLIVQLRTAEGRVLEKKIRSEDASIHADYPLHDEMDVLVDDRDRRHVRSARSRHKGRVRVIPHMQSAASIKKDEEDFYRESRGKKVCYVHINQAVVKDESHMIHIDLGSCASVVLCGLDGAGKAWFGVNHLFKSRIANSDMALEQVAALYNSMKEQDVKRICCLGLFGAGYRENSLARSTGADERAHHPRGAEPLQPFHRDLPDRLQPGHQRAEVGRAGELPHHAQKPRRKIGAHHRDTADPAFQE